MQRRRCVEMPAGRPTCMWTCWQKSPKSSGLSAGTAGQAGPPHLLLWTSVQTGAGLQMQSHWILQRLAAGFCLVNGLRSQTRHTFHPGWGAESLICWHSPACRTGHLKPSGTARCMLRLLAPARPACCLLSGRACRLLPLGSSSRRLAVSALSLQACKFQGYPPQPCQQRMNPSVLQKPPSPPACSFLTLLWAQRGGDWWPGWPPSGCWPSVTPAIFQHTRAMNSFGLELPHVPDGLWQAKKFTHN